MQVTNTQQAMPEGDLTQLKSSIAAFLSKAQAPVTASPAATADSAIDSTGAAAPARGAGSPPRKTPDKTTLAKKSKAGTEPAAPALSTCEGQMAELSKWNSILSTGCGFSAQDMECADWLASSLKYVAQPILC